MNDKLAAVQAKLKAPKNQRNSFGNYNYRSCEDILEAVKPLLKEEGLILTISDDIQIVGERVYVKAVAEVTDGEHKVSVSAFAREPAEKKGMDESQITGAASSYARKYALNGLFLIDDVKDADTQDNREVASAETKECPMCKSHMTKRDGKYGEFWGCSNYPKCKQKPIPVM